MSPTRPTIDHPADSGTEERRPARRSARSARGRLTQNEAAACAFTIGTPVAAAWDDLLGYLLEEARGKQPAAQPDPNLPQPRRAPALTPARRAALTHQATIPRHRWPAACEALMNARHAFEADVATDGRSIIVRCSPQVAAALHPYATGAQP
jgi:hypothetical protein